MVNHIKQLREAAGLKQYELAARAGVKPASVHKWEKGIGMPTAENIVKLTRILNCTSDALLGLEPVKNGQNSA